jgi:stage II sporulation protein M
MNKKGERAMLKRLRLLWLDNRGYFLIASILLMFGALVGYLQADKVAEVANQLLSELKQIVGRIQQDGGGTVTTFRVIFFNNVSSSLMMMVLGLFFAVFPIFGLLSNGVLLGFIMDKIAAAGINPLLVFSVGILPHGIFELPAVVFAAAIGIRYGVLVIRSIGSLWRLDARADVRSDWIAVLKQFPMAVLVVVVLLFVAAVVESVITPLLLQNTIGGQFQLK